MIAYWFSKLDGTTEYQTVPACIGRTDTVGGTPVPCHHGLHASPTPWDALQYASEGMMMWEVRLGGTIVEHGRPVDKYAAQQRTYLRKVDLTRICYMFAAEQALSVIDKWDAPAVVREYLTDTARGLDRSDIRLDAREAAYAARGAAAFAHPAAYYAAYAAADAAYAATDAANTEDYDARVSAFIAAGKRFNELAMEALSQCVTN